MLFNFLICLVCLSAHCQTSAFSVTHVATKASTARASEKNSVARCTQHLFKPRYVLTQRYMGDSDDYMYSENTDSNNTKKKKRPNQKNKKPQNEFSRPIHTDVILSPRSSRRQYNAQIAAEEEELENLANRFSLSKITKLDADLTLTKDSARSASGSSSRSVNSGACIQVEGDVVAKVTQTCVRTNEDFDVDMEFSIFSIVRATEIRETRQNNELGGMSLAQIEGQLGGGDGYGGRRGKKKKKKQKGGGSSIGNGGALNDMKMKEIESLLQEFNMEDDIFEDENVLASDGILDVGELVAQMFRLKLDPYPKKPGSEPVSYSISG